MRPRKLAPFRSSQGLTRGRAHGRGLLPDFLATGRTTFVPR
jgi:hypothetical protein